MKLGFLQQPEKALSFAIYGATGCVLAALLGELVLKAVPRANGSGAGSSAPVVVFDNDFEQRLAREGAKSGDVQLSLKWNNQNDLDLHCIDPNNEEIYYKHKKSLSGGELDVDMNANVPYTNRPVENIYWPANGAPTGIYKVYVYYYGQHDQYENSTAFEVGIKHNGVAKQLPGTIAKGDSPLLMDQFTFELPGTEASAGVSRRTVLVIGLWTALLAMGVGGALVFRQNQLMRRPPLSPEQWAKVGLRSALTGFIAGALSQLLFSLMARQGVSMAAGRLTQLLSLAMMGLLLGWGMSLFIPNLSARFSAVAGLVGGLLGGAAFLLLAHSGLETGGRLAGGVALGFCIGLMVALAEELAREASLVVHWGPKDRLVLSLGATPILLGSSREAHINLPASQGFPPVAGLVTFSNGQVRFEDRVKARTYGLANGSKLQIGSLTLEVQTSA